jgi:hypothetical protein
MKRPPFPWDCDSIALLRSLWEDGVLPSIIAKQLGNGATAAAVSKKARRIGLQAMRGSGGNFSDIRKEQAKEARERSKRLRAFIAAEIERGAEREQTILAGISLSGTPRRRVATIFREEFEKRTVNAIQLGELEFAPGVFASDARSYELIQRARAA